MKTWKSSFLVFVSKRILFCTEIWYFEKLTKVHDRWHWVVRSDVIHQVHRKCLTVLYKYLKLCPNLYFWSLLGNGVLFYAEISYFERLTNAYDEWLWIVRSYVIHHMHGNFVILFIQVWKTLWKSSFLVFVSKWYTLLYWDTVLWKIN